MENISLPSPLASSLGFLAFYELLKTPPPVVSFQFQFQFQFRFQLYFFLLVGSDDVGSVATKFII